VCVCEGINAKSGDERGTTNPGHAPIACSSMRQYFISYQ